MYTLQCYRIKNSKMPLMSEEYRYIMEGVHDECVDISIPMLEEIGLTLDDVEMVYDVRDKLWDHLDKNAVIDEDVVLEKINQIYASQPMLDLRIERDKRIAETDWWCLSDRTPTQEQLDYRQALRDITLNYSSLEDVVWPLKPT